MAKILGISGSLRRASFNSALLRAAVELTPSGSTLEVGTIRGIPLYDADVEAEHGSPEAVSALKERVLQNQALLICRRESRFRRRRPHRRRAHPRHGELERFITGFAAFVDKGS